MNKSLEEVILPAIPAENKAALEQAKLVIGSLNLIQEQMDYANWFEVVDGRSMVAMAEKIANISGRNLGKSLDDAIAAARDLGSRHDVTLSQLRNANYNLRESLSEAIGQVLADADDEMARAISRIVIEMSEDQTSRERAFVAKTGFDVFPDSLKSIPDALKASPFA